MRNSIHEFLNYTDEEKQNLWDNAIFIFDTNVFLNLYRYTEKTRAILLSAIEKLKTRVWMPNHVAREFMKNRNNIIWETNHQYDGLRKKAEDFVAECQSTLKLENGDKDIDTLKESIYSWIEKAKKKNVVVSTYGNDAILNKLLSIYENKVGSELSYEELSALEEEGKKRYAAEIPPGYKDAGKKKGENPNNMYGDLIFWKQILNYASSEKKDIILVTNDQKEDWWEIVHGENIGPRIELRKEFSEKTAQRFHMYSMKSFITRFESGNEVIIDSETIDEIEFFSNVIRHKTNKQSLRDYYDSFESDDEIRAAKKRFQITRIEIKNRKRLNTIKAVQEKYADDEMPEEIETMIENTLANYEKDNLRIQKIRAELSNYGG